MASEWKKYRLEEVCEFANGFAFKSTDYVAPSMDTIEVFRMGYIRRGGGFKEDETPVFAPREYGRSLDHFYLLPGDITIAMTDMKDRVAILGNAAWIKDANRFVLNQRVGRLRVKQCELLDPRFLYYYSNWGPHVEYLRSRANSGVQVNLSTTTIKEAVIEVPALPEQQAIACILGALDDKIELNRRMSRTLESIARALFKSWFVDFDPVRAKAAGRQTVGLKPEIAALFPDGFEDSELGEIPKGWRVGTIREQASRIQYGLTTSASAEPVGPRFLRITDIRGGSIDWTKVPYCEATEDERSKYHVVDGDIVVARTGASTGENVYLITPPIAVFASYLVRFQFTEPGYARVVGEFMRSPEYSSFVESALGGSAQPNANAQTLAGASLVFPPPLLAKWYFEMIRPLDLQRAIHDNEISTLASVRNTLLPKLISGELRVPDAERILGGTV